MILGDKNKTQRIEQLLQRGMTLELRTKGFDCLQAHTWAHSEPQAAAA